MSWVSFIQFSSRCFFFCLMSSDLSITFEHCFSSVFLVCFSAKITCLCTRTHLKGEGGSILLSLAGLLLLSRTFTLYLESWEWLF